MRDEPVVGLDPGAGEELRLFVAVYPSPSAVASLVAACPVFPPPWRPVPTEDWHLTLSFLGQVSESALPELGERLSRAAARSGPLSVGVAGGGAFPSIRRARVFWAGVVGDRDRLVRLAERTTAAARRTRIAVEDRRYRPHLTLARVRSPAGTDAEALVAGLQGYAGPTEPVAEIVLVRSFTGPSARHVRLAGFALRQAGR